jgi:hypothetical protein
VNEQDGAQVRHIFLIYTPGWVHWSAGIKVLHYLCHELNQLGFHAYLAIHGPRQEFDANPNLNTPAVTLEIVRELELNSVKFVAIYPESIEGNPLQANHVVRWILNYPRLLGGENKFLNEHILSYSRVLAESLKNEYGLESEVCFIPAIKIEEMDELRSEITKLNIKPSLELVYAQKYRALGGASITLGENQREIYRFGRDATSREQTLELLRDAQLLHVYENSTIISEACLLGTPVICHKNEYFTELIAKYELNFSGVSWSTLEISTPDVESNRKILSAAEAQVKDSLNIIFQNLEFAPLELNKRLSLRLPRRGIITVHSLKRAKVVFDQLGTKALFKFFLNYINR